ncbi:MAG: ROK family protein [Lentisphaeria bacterium]|jgi:glucokinase
MATACKVGIDVGGTKIFTVLVDAADGRILARAKGDTPAREGVGGVLDAMHHLSRQALDEAGLKWEQVQHVGVALPGAVDQKRGWVLHAVALGWRNEPVRQLLAKRFGREVHLDNDVNCGVLAEARLGAGRGVASVAGLFVGTGLGGGLVLDGRLFRGCNGGAGEFGHMIVRHHGRKCGCGHRGCLEAYCSKTAFGRRFEKMINRRGIKSELPGLVAGGDFRNVRSKLLAKAYRQGDPVVCNVLDKGATMLGIGVANIMAILMPGCVVLGGGVIEALGKELLPLVRRSAERHLFGMDPQEMVLRLAETGDDAVALGAAILDH